MPGRSVFGQLPSQVGDGDLRAVAQAHFGKDRADVVAHGAFAHISGGSDLLVVETAGDELGDFELAVGQADKGRGPAGRAGLDARSIKVDILDRLTLEYAFAGHDLRQRRWNGSDIGFIR